MIGDTLIVEDFFQCYNQNLSKHQSIHTAIEDFKLFPNGLIDLYDNQHQPKERREAVVATAQSILFMHREQQKI